MASGDFDKLLAALEEDVKNVASVNVAGHTHTSQLPESDQVYIEPFEPSIPPPPSLDDYTKNYWHPKPFWVDFEVPAPEKAKGEFKFNHSNPPIPQEDTSVPPVQPEPLLPTLMNYVYEGNIKTQKALGFRAIFEHKAAEGLYGPGYMTASSADLPMNQIRLYPQCQWPDKPFEHRMFARPCPITPRHGFVESREVKTVEEAQAVFAEARAADPQAEMILMPQLTGVWSGVATSVGVHYGWGNDGVTSNTSRTILIPTPGTSAKHLKTAMYNRFGDVKQFGIHEGQDVYFEIVEHNGLHRLVQMRAGPEQPTTKNFVPQDTVVARVIENDEYDLLKWEAKILKAKGEPGVVVHLANSPLSSHFAVHAIANNIPVWTEWAPPVIGQLLKTEKLDVPALTEADYTTLRDLVLRYEDMDFLGDDRDTNSWRKRSEMITTAFASIHAMSLWGNEPHLLALRAFAVVASVRFIAAAAFGELRHWFGQGPGRHGRKYPCKHVIDHVPEIKDLRDRQGVYDRLLEPAKTKVLRNALDCAERGFRAYGWGDSESNYRRHEDEDTHSGSGYGGKNWSNVSRAGRDLASALDSFMHYPSADLWAKVVGSANVALHTAHNNGHCVNKWVSSNTLGTIAQAPVFGFLNAFAAQTVLEYNPK